MKVNSYPWESFWIKKITEIWEHISLAPLKFYYLLISFYEIVRIRSIQRIKFFIYSKKYLINTNLHKKICFKSVEWKIIKFYFMYSRRERHKESYWLMIMSFPYSRRREKFSNAFRLSNSSRCSLRMFNVIRKFESSYNL